MEYLDFATLVIGFGVAFGLLWDIKNGLASLKKSLATHRRDWARCTRCLAEAAGKLDQCKACKAWDTELGEDPLISR